MSALRNSAEQQLDNALNALSQLSKVSLEALEEVLENSLHNCDLSDQALQLLLDAGHEENALRGNEPLS